MANISANKFKKNHDVTLSCVYTSPLHRAFMTAYEFAKILELPLIIVPGLACAEACKQFGPIITKSDGTMALKKKIKALYCQTVRLDLDVQNGKPLDVEIDYKGLL